MSLFSPRRGFAVSNSLANGNGGAFTIDDGVTSGSNYFPIPYVAWNWKRHESNAIGVSIYGRGGMNTDYSGGSATFDPDGPGPAPVMSLPGVFGAGNMGVDFSQIFVDLTYARKVGDLSWGISAVFAIQALEPKGVATFAPYSRTFAASGGTQMPVALSDNGHDLSTGGGLKVGGIWQASPNLRFAASYQSELSMSEFDDYSDLFADGGNFDIPASTKAGLSWDASSRITWHLDVEYTEYNSIKPVGRTSSALFSCPTAGAGGMDLEACLGGSRGAGFGWDNMTTWKTGVRFRPESLSNWQFRAGYSQGDQPVDATDILFNIIAPGVMEQHFTFGATHMAQRGEFNVALMYAPQHKVAGASPFDPPQVIELRMRQFELEFSYSW